MQNKVIHHFHFRILNAGERFTKHMRLPGISLVWVVGTGADLMPILETVKTFIPLL